MDVSRALLKKWRLPSAEASGDKETRGKVLVIGGSFGMSGAAILTATAALRAGAGKLQIACPHSITSSVALAVPESMVVALPEKKNGRLADSAVIAVLRHPETDALVVGPGMQGGDELRSFVSKVLSSVKTKIAILDAEAMKCLDRPNLKLLRALKGRAVITPHAGEMANLIQRSKSYVEENSLEVAVKFADEFGIVTVLKGGETIIAEPHGKVFTNKSGNIGLATSGSGDCLAGLIAGLGARGATPIQAAVWGAFVHGKGGEALARRFGLLGYLARELPQEYPRILSDLQFQT